MHADTKNVLIECTATDLTKAGVVVDTVVAMFAEYCKEPFTYEPVEIVYPNGEKMVYPLMPYRMTEVRMLAFLSPNLRHLA